jgi:aquaporin Z
MKGSQAIVYSHDSTAKLLSEFVGVFFLVLTIGCNVHTTSIGAPLSIGMMLTVMVFSLGSVSGAHFNPAVTLAITLRGKMDVESAVKYMLVQICAGIIAALTYSAITGGAFIFAPVWQYTAGAALTVELLYSIALIYVVLNVATTDVPNQFFGLAVGMTVTAGAVAIGSVSGCSLNPAVSIGCLFAAAFRHGFSATHFWALYTFTPFLAALIATALFFGVRPGERKRLGMGEARPLLVEAPVEVSNVPPPASSPPPRVSGPAILSSGETFYVPGNLEHSEVALGLAYELHDPSLRGMLEIDGSCVKFDRDGKCLGAVYFADKEDTESGITHYGLHTGELGSYAHGDDDQIRFRLDNIKGNVQFLFFVVTLFSDGQHSLQDVKNMNARLVNMSTPGAAEVFKFSRQFESSEKGNAYVAVFLYRTKDGHWACEAVDRAYALVEAGTYRMLEPQLKRLCLQRKEMGM